LKSKQFDSPVLNTNELYGKYFGQYRKQDLEKFFRRYFLENGFTLTGKDKNDKNDKKLLPWENVTFFKLEKFNNLTEKGIEQLKGKINEIGILKTEDLSQYTINSRVKYFRAYENWSDKEKELLEKAMKYTNDVELLSACFQRGKGSIKACGKRLIYEKNLVLSEELS
jgi:alpha-amylase/alpha-mannosidase (GH57 family)